jgi:uncharacterized repeat protein (TIGR01451 family)
MAEQRFANSPDVRADLAVVHKEDVMRPWMKVLAVGGVVGVALGVSLASEKSPERRSGPSNSPSRSSRLEYFSRGGSSDDRLDLPTDPAIEELAVEVSATPKKFTRSTAAMPDTPTPAKTNTSARPTKGDAAQIKPSQVADQRAAKPVTGRVELLPAPDSDVAEELPIKHKLMAKKSNTSIQPASFDARPSDPIESPDEELTGEIIAADFHQKPQAKPRVQPARAEQAPPSTPSNFGAEPGPDAAVAKPNRVSVVTDRSAKPLSATTSGSHRATERITPRRAEASSTPSVSVEWVKQGGIIVGQECACDLVVKNNGRVPAREIVVEALFPNTVRLTHADPEPAEVSDHLEWSLAELAPGDERIIHIRMIPSQRGNLATTANVRFTGTAANVFQVEEPLLKLAVAAPAEVVVGDPVVQTITITNPGTGIAQNVKLDVALPEGLEFTRGDRSRIEIGALSPGESRTVRLSLTSIGDGEQRLEVTATGDSGLKQSAAATVAVIAPALKIAVEGPGSRQTGRDARYTLTVSNDGKAATNNVRVTHRIPDGFKFVRADKGGTLDADHRFVHWFIGRLEPSQTIEVRLQLQAQEIGEFEHQVSVTAEHGATAQALATTNVEGSASLVMEVQDLDNPVEIGKETAYEVRVSNNGSKAAQNVGLTFELPSGIELLNVVAAPKHLAKNGLILFNDIPELAPGKTALFRIHVKGQAEGNQRVRARLTSESIEQELITEETTKFEAE